MPRAWAATCQRLATTSGRWPSNCAGRVDGSFSGAARDRLGRCNCAPSPGPLPPSAASWLRLRAISSSRASSWRWVSGSGVSAWLTSKVGADPGAQGVCWPGPGSAVAGPTSAATMSRVGVVQRQLDIGAHHVVLQFELGLARLGQRSCAPGRRHARWRCFRGPTDRGRSCRPRDELLSQVLAPLSSPGP